MLEQLLGSGSSYNSADNLLVSIAYLVLYAIPIVLLILIYKEIRKSNKKKY